MSLFPFLQLQTVDPDDDQSDLDKFEKDEISLDDSIDANALEASWGEIVEDIESDPSWKSFYAQDEGDD